MNWVLITGAYPPDKGGLADYTEVLARELARQGDAVTVITGPLPAPPAKSEGVDVRMLSDHFGKRGLAELAAWLATVPEPRRIFIQYVPQALGPRRSSRFKGLPLTFTWWLRQHAKDWSVWTMFHEAKVTAPPGTGLPRKALSTVTERMLGWTVRSSERVFVAMDAWRPDIERYLPPGRRVESLPIPSNVATVVDTRLRDQTRKRLLNGHARTIVGHFGTFSEEVTSLLAPVIERSLTEHPDRQILLVGDGGQQFAEQLSAPERVTATGRLEAEQVACHLAACDLMVQPFPDGASTRRGSIMAGIALGVPVVSNWGQASEPCWKEERALALAPDVASLPEVIDELLAQPEERQALGERGRQLYADRFSLEHTARSLRA